ncbi:MAG: ScpA family protein [Azospirillaceae bacterium]
MSAGEDTNAPRKDRFVGDTVDRDDFDDDGARAADDFILRLETYEGPIDLLLDQARDQKVDLAQISILALAEQYLDFVERARSLRLELAADYLVMAAWLAYLKSRLLLPAEADDEEPTAAEMAAALQFQLQRLEAMRRSATALMARDLLGRDVFARGAPEGMVTVREAVYQVSLFELLQAYGAQHRRKTVAGAGLQINASRLFSTDEAVRRLTAMLGGIKGWADLTRFLPVHVDDPLLARSALATTFAASLEMAKAGRAELRQERSFAPIMIRARG